MKLHAKKILRKENTFTGTNIRVTKHFLRVTVLCHSWTAEMTIQWQKLGKQKKMSGKYADKTKRRVILELLD